jgi:hypothetical protein
LILSALILSAGSSPSTGQDYENETVAARPDDERAESSPRAPSLVQPSLFAESAPGPASEKAEPEPEPELFDLGAMAGGAAGTGAALPTLQGDTTWGGRPAFPHVIAPALDLTYPGPGLPIYNDNTNHLVFQASGNFKVDPGPLPQSLKSADLVLGLLGFPVATNSYLPFSAMLLSSPIIGYDMINWAENGTITPQDRVFLDYRHFDAVGSVELISLKAPDATHQNAYYSQQQFSPLSVDRYCLGVEKTFRDGLWSVEVRLPFESKAAAAQTFGPGEPLADDFAIGNVGLALKRYLVRSDRWTITGGLGLQLPTAPPTDLTYKTHFGMIWYQLFVEFDETLRVQQANETVWLNPFLGVCYDGHGPLFAQGMFQLCVPLNQSSATVTTDVPNGRISFFDEELFNFNTTPIHERARITMAFEPLFRANVDLGCWLYQNSSGRVNWLAALLEVNNTNTIGTRYSSNIVNLGPQLAMGIGKTKLDAGMLVPVTGDQAYKSEFVFRVNRRF